MNTKVISNALQEFERMQEDAELGAIVRMSGWRLVPPVMTNRMQKAMLDAMENGTAVWPAILEVLPKPTPDGRISDVTIE
jgi:hypothetical protein